MPLYINAKLAALSMANDSEKNNIGEEIADMLKEYANSL